MSCALLGAQCVSLKLHYDMYMASMLLGVQVKIPVSVLKFAPDGTSDCRFRVTESPSLSDIATVSIASSPIVAFSAELTMITGLRFAEIAQTKLFR